MGRLRKEEADKKAKEAEEKRKRLEEAEKKRQAMMQAQKEKQQAAGQGAKGPKKTDSGMGNVQDARREMTKTKEQLEEEKKISLSIRIKPLDLDAMDGDMLNNKATELWDTIVRLETEKYDLEERQKRQDYDLKELKERQKQQLRQKAMKKGLDPEALTESTHPRFACTPNMNAELTQEHTKTGESCMKAVGRSYTQNTSKNLGKKRWKIGRQGRNPNCQNGSESAQARNPENQNLPRMTKKEVKLPQLKLKRKKRKKKRKKRRKKKRKKRKKKRKRRRKKKRNKF